MNGYLPLQRYITASLLILIGLLTSIPSWAKTQDRVDLDSARQLFLRAEQALDEDKLASYQVLKMKLHDYPLLPYLEYQALRKKFHTLKAADVSSALAKFSDTPLQHPLRRDWLNTLANQGRWDTYLQFATPGGTVSQQCRRLTAMLKTGQRSQALHEVEPIWLYGYSRPKACDPALNAWIDSDHLTEQLVWRRITLAMDNNQLRLARYLKRFLPAADRSWVDRWIELHKHPVNPQRLLREKHDYVDEIAVDTLNSMIRQDVLKALETWQVIQDNPRLSDSQKLRVVRTLAAFLALRHDKGRMQRLRDLVPLHLRSDAKFNEKLLQVALRANDWNLVLDTVESLNPEEQKQEHWRYWRARALSELGRREEANKLFIGLAKERSYYGFMAADYLGQGFSFLHQTLPVSDSLIEQMADLPGLRRARELFALERTLEARREWNLALRDSSADELKAAAKLAQEWDWPSQVILTLAKLRYWNDLELRFPLNHRQQVDRQAKDHGLESAWIYAIVRQESAFSVDARSRAGAIGLMQLMPTTAKEVAAKTDNRSFKVKDLLQPEINIELGASYLNQIYRRLQENPVLATAAYNAGPSRVMGWLPEQPLASDVWIETVPFRETREYLKRVLAYTVIYNHRLGNDSQRLPDKWQQPIGTIHAVGKALAKTRSDA
jgi:soluble lytic murein transglycosylase